MLIRELGYIIVYAQFLLVENVRRNIKMQKESIESAELFNIQLNLFTLFSDLRLLYNLSLQIFSL